MKNLILIILFFAFLVPCKSQDLAILSGQIKKTDYLRLSEEYQTGVESVIETVDYDSIMVAGKIWSNLIGGYGSKMIECCYSTTFLKIECDSLDNSTDEKQLLESTDSLQTWKKIGDIIELDKKVYFKDLENNQGLLYDFSASPGDTVDIVNYSDGINTDTIHTYVEAIDTLEYMGIKRQRFKVRNIESGDYDYWITGIGSVKGFLFSLIELTGGIRELLCVHDNGTLVYQNEDRATCYMDGNPTGIENGSTIDLNIYPNPTSGYINIKYSGVINDLSYSIYNSDGKIINCGQLTNETINLNLKQGLYIFQLFENDKLILEKKIISKQ